MSLDGFRRHLTASGCGAHGSIDITPDDKIHRYRLHDDKPGRVNGAYQVKEEADGFTVGWCRDWKTGETHSYTSGYKRGAPREERRAHQERREKAAAEQRKRDAEALRLTADRAGRLWSQTTEAHAEGNAYLDRKGIGAGPARMARGLLVVPVYIAGELSSLQYIQEDGSKRFLKGRGSTDGGYCVWSGSRETVYLCEGFATAGSVHAATGCEAVVAFNAGNMVKVAQWAVGEYPDSRVIICADNDINGDQDEITAKSNPGRFWAMQAAGKAGGLAVVYPEIEGDFNDLHAAEGLDAVKAVLESVPEPVVAEDMGDWEPDYGDMPEPEMESMPAKKPRKDSLSAIAAMVRPLGYDGEVYYFLPRVTGQIVKLTPPGMASVNNLYRLGSLYDWQDLMGDYEMKPGEIPGIVTPALMHLCHSKGVYNPEIVRGAGAWPEGKSAVINLGDTVFRCATGETITHNDMSSGDVYIRSTGVYDLDCEPLRNAEANKLRQICDKLTWKRGMNGTLLAGWLVLAPIGGALYWRPHVFLTGSKGAGKSTVINDVVMRMLDRIAIKMDGGSTEAGLRGAVKESTRPVIMDEFEGENKRDAEQVDKILNWARKGSSGGVITNANGSFRARSCVCFAAINPLVIKDADVERNTILELDVNRSPDREEQYSELLDMIHDTLTDEYADRMIKRTVENIDTLLHNCGVFIKHTSRVLGSKRAGDQIGTLLAGAYMLNSTARVTEEKAAEWVAMQDWSWHDDESEGSDTESLMQYILTAMVEHTMLDRTGKMPVAELIERVREGSNGHEDAAKTLGRYGLAVVDGWLRIANKANRLSELLSNTIYHVYKPTLSRYPGVRSGDAPYRFSAGVVSRYMEIPLEAVMSSGVIEDEGSPF